MIDRRSMLKFTGAAALGTLALNAVASGTDLAFADGSPEPPQPASVALLPDPATTVVPNPPYPKGLTHEERTHLVKFDELDFDVFTHAEWSRLGESHAKNIRAHWPDGHFTDGLDKHIADLAALFAWAPDTRILEHPLRVAKDNLTAVTGVMRGTFTRPMADGKGGHIPPTGKAYAINMATVGIWNRSGVMDEEFLFWDNLTFYQQIGLA
ncbi:MAG: hypothetical protein QOE71_62 [Pseudonocardiales bacterium]|jgi:hypothetical protein|nr:hypothetical protein [Pseudonocardiales bacterium]